MERNPVSFLNSVPSNEQIAMQNELQTLEMLRVINVMEWISFMVNSVFITKPQLRYTRTRLGKRVSVLQPKEWVSSYNEETRRD